MEEQRIRNPRTGRLIKTTGVTYIKLVYDGVIKEKCKNQEGKDTYHCGTQEYTNYPRDIQVFLLGIVVSAIIQWMISLIT